MIYPLWMERLRKSIKTNAPPKTDGKKLPIPKPSCDRCTALSLLAELDGLEVEDVYCIKCGRGVDE